MSYRIYGFEGCPYCQKAKALLDKEGIPFEYVDIPTSEGRRVFMDARGFAGRDRTFPRVYLVTPLGERLVGGSTELESHLLFG